MNERGASFISLNSVAVAIGLSRNTLYYYFKSRADLVYGCHLLAVESMAADIASTCLVEQCPAQCLHRFIELSLKGERIAISDLTQLDETQQGTIRSLKKENEDCLQRVIERGVTQGLLRKTNPVIACQVLLGLLNWSQLSNRWFNNTETQLYQHMSVSAISDLFLYGISQNSNLNFSCGIDYRSLSTTQFNAFDSSSINEERRRQLLGKASLLFNQRGIDAVSLDDIADYIGTSKGAVYYYYKDKPSLVRACYEQAFKQYDLFIETAMSRTETNRDALLSIGHLNSQAQASDFPPLILQPGESVFSENYRIQINQLKDKIQNIRERCFSDGDFRDIDSSGIELSAGTNFWISRWIKDHPGQAKSFGHGEIADIICGILTYGIKKRST